MHIILYYTVCIIIFYAYIIYCAPEKMINEPPPIYDPSRRNLICKPRCIYYYIYYTVSSRRFYTTRRRVNYNGIIPYTYIYMRPPLAVQNLHNGCAQCVYPYIYICIMYIYEPPETRNTHTHILHYICI